MMHFERASTLVCGYKIETANLWKVATAAGVLLCALGIFGALGLAQHYGALNCTEGFASLIGKITVPALGVMTGLGILGFALAALGCYQVYRYTQTLARFTVGATQGGYKSNEEIKQETKDSLNQRFVAMLEMQKNINADRVNLLTPIETQDRLDNNQCVYLPISTGRGIFVRKMDNHYSYLAADGGGLRNMPTNIKSNLEWVGFTFPENDRNGVKFEGFSNAI